MAQVLTEQNFHYAGFWRRFVAYIIDMILINILIGLSIVILVAGMGGVSTVTGKPEVFGGIGAIFFLIIIFLGPLIWFAAFEASPMQATPGKRAVSLKVTDETGNRITFWNSIGRNLGKIVSTLILYIGFMMAGWTRRKQALHDLMAGCLVIRRID